MVQKVKAAVGKRNFSLILALLFSGAFFASNFRPEAFGPDQLARHGFMFLLQFTAIYLLCASLRRRFTNEKGSLGGEPVSNFLLWAFILYKEGVKTVIGVSLTLGWIAGLLFIAETFGDQIILVPVLLGVALSAVLFLPAWFFSSLLDQIRYPQKS